MNKKVVIIGSNKKNRENIISMIKSLALLDISSDELTCSTNAEQISAMRKCFKLVKINLNSIKIKNEYDRESIKKIPANKTNTTNNKTAYVRSYRHYRYPQK